MLIVVGVIAGIIAFGLLAGGCALVAVDQTQRDDDGFLMSPSEDFTTTTYAIVSESADLDTTARSGRSTHSSARAHPERERARRLRRHRTGADVDGYLEGVEHDVVVDLDGDPEYNACRRGTGLPRRRADLLGGTGRGTGEQTLEWEPEDGDWRVVLMNDDAARGVSSELRIGAELDAVLWIGIGMLVAGGLLAARRRSWRSRRARVGALTTR